MLLFPVAILSVSFQVVRQGEQLKYLENLNWDHEKTITDLEEDIVELLKVRVDQEVMSNLARHQTRVTLLAGRCLTLCFGPGPGGSPS